MSRDNDEAVAVGSRPGRPVTADDFRHLRRDYVWRAPERVTDAAELDVRRNQLDAAFRAAPLPVEYVGQRGAWRDKPTPKSALSPAPPPEPTPSPKPSPSQPSTSSPSSSPSPKPPQRHKRYLRRCPCPECETRRANTTP